MAGWGGTSLRISPDQFPDPDLDIEATGGEQSVILGGGCFWCVEAVFEQVEGVLGLTSGYAGGSAKTADYKTVCTGRTGHAEVVQIRFDPSILSYGQVLKLFLSVAHDPTTLNRQGADVGTQYRSVIFYQDAEQKRVAEAYIDQLDAAGVFDKKIVTSLEPLETFYVGEDYHQGYASANPYQPYIMAVAAPKVEKLQTYFADRLKGAKSGAGPR
ncbi:MAG: peptide-methionine (S)-S-oxide reductase MsrA [Chloroflexi bacterium]|nr:peptide-methionine (S)-S-oxide reductase MsrA [Chloroflexota bacterium]